jgi:hypothetical protein
MPNAVIIDADVLRAHYGAAEFEHFDDAHLNLAIGRATATVDRYLTAAQQDEITAETLQPVVLTIARAYAHDEQPLDSDHPVIRELTEALRWLQTQSDRFAARTIAASDRALIGVTSVRSSLALLTDALEGMLP